MNKEHILSHLDFKSFYHSHIIGFKETGSGQATGLCPFHNDTHASLSINLANGLYNCFACNAKGNVLQFYQNYKKVDSETALKEIAEIQGISEPATQGKVVATFEYKDTEGKTLYIKDRIEPARNGRSKEFIFKHPEGDKWLTGRGCEPVPYNLPALSKSKYTFITEGEAKADLLMKWGLTATCLDSGANSPFREDYLKHFAGKEKVIILPDNDNPGKSYAEKIASALYGKAGKIKIVELPELKEAEDVIDWVKIESNNKEKLLEIVKTSPEWIPSNNQDTKTGMTLIRLDELLKESDESVSYLVDNTLPSGGFSVLASKPKAGKSTLARNLALSVARGEAFLGKDTNKGAVIYYALEEKQSEIKRHFKDMGADGTEDIYIYTGSVPVDALIQIKSIVEKIKPVLVIIDPLFRLARVKDGNDYVQVTQALDPLLRLARDTGTHVLCVHHTNKGQGQGGDSVLGSTAIFSSVDTLLIMKRHEEYRTVSSIQRYGEDLPETTLHFDKDSRTIEIGKPKQEEDIETLKRAILDFLSSQDKPLIKSVIMEEVEERQAIKHKALMELVKNEQVAREGSGGKGDPYKYSITLLPIIYGVIPKQHFENPENPHKQRANGITQENTENQESEKSRVIAFSNNFDLKEGEL
ncbi:MAG: AAA family ATPase [Nitrospinae bacterium]|nr:AAA family ATPase [Nitrospinota bacterium]